jgi:AraC family transcriptional regulator of arabinose operon
MIQPAMMPPPILLCGKFLQHHGYQTQRPGGSCNHLMILTQRGAGVVKLGGTSTVVGPDRLLLFEPGAAQDYATNPQTGLWELAWAHFHLRSHWSPLINWPHWRKGIRILELPPGEARRNIRLAFDKMIRAARLPLENAGLLGLTRLEEALLWADLVVRNDKALQIDPRIRKAIDYLALNFQEAFDLTRIARVHGLSVTRFSQLFKQATGQTPQRFSETAKTNHAIFLLQETNLAVFDVASQCGYEDPLYFSRRFRLATGQPPSVFRRENVRLIVKS